MTKQRFRPHLEMLETRYLPSTVTNLADSDPGSLRDAIATTEPGGIVDFQPDLAGTIILTSGELAINKDLTIAGPGAGIITVAGDNARMFNIAQNFTVDISGLSIGSFYHHGDDGNILNAGNLVVSDAIISHGYAAFSHGAGIFNSG
jgi:hypothetical protein